MGFDPSKLDRVISGAAVGDSPDLRRILALPRRPVVEAGSAKAQALIELARERYRLTEPGVSAQNGRKCKCRSKWQRDCIEDMNFIQAWMLHELRQCGGGFGGIGVGWGKTFLNLLASLAVKGTKKALLLAPPNLITQLAHDYEFLAQHWRVPNMAIVGQNGVRRQKDMRTVLTVLPYSRLSRPDASELIESIDPDLIISDEVDKLRHLKGAGAGRVKRAFKRKPSRRFAGWTGTPTNSGVEDYSHLLKWALGEGSPLPLKSAVVQEWGTALDPTDGAPAPPGALMRMCAKGEGIRAGYKRRLCETPGVVFTTSAAVKSPLKIRRLRPSTKMSPDLKQYIRDVRETWTRPDGEELQDQLSLIRCLWQLACGFYTRFEFPHGEKAEDIEAWFQARQEWNVEARAALQYRAKPNFDSPKLVENAARRHWDTLEYSKDGKRRTPVAKHLPKWKALAWPRWLELKDTVRPVSVSQRIDDFLVRDVAAWAKQNVGIVWSGHVDFADWIGELSGMPVFGGGKKNAALLMKEKGDRPIVCSIKSHGRGRDGLQYRFTNQLIATPPSTPSDWEQLLGRLHRTGQGECVTVLASYYDHTKELRALVRKALRRSEYVHETTGGDLKLLQGGVQEQGESEDA